MHQGPKERSLLPLVLLFVASGVSGLVYQVVWMRELTLVLGISTLATAAVLTAFMGGFGLGAFLLGPTSDRVARPLRLFALVELGIALFALGVPWLSSALEPAYAAASRSVPAPLLPALRFGVAVLTLMPPTILMGASLPAMVAEARRRGRGTRDSLGALYTANLVGAISGALLAGFVLIRTLGLSSSNALAAGLNVAVAGAAWALARPLPRLADEPARAAAEPSADLARLAGIERLLTPLLFLSGFVVLALEVLWTRVLVFTVGSTVYGFAVVLAVTLLGLALGARLAPALLGKGADVCGRLALAHAGVAATAGLALVLGPWLMRFSLFLSASLFGESGFGLLAASSVASGAVLLVPATLAGLCFPALLAVQSAARANVGSAVGRAQAVNAAGAILGPAVASLVLIPLVGLAGSFALLAALELLAALALAAVATRRAVAFAGAAVALALSALPFVLARAGRADALDGRLAYEYAAEPELIDYREGSVASVSVVQDQGGGRALRLDGFEAAASRYGPYMRVMGLAPLAFHPAPKEALTICFGTGTTAGAVAREGALARLDVVELEPVVLEMAPHFAATNHGVLEDPRVVTHAEDGRAFVVAAPRDSLDLLTLEPMPPTHAGVVNLYSREFYEHAARALRPDGVIAQWVPMHLTDGEETAGVVATFAEVFPNALMLMVGTTGILVGTRAERPLLDLDALGARLRASPGLVAELASAGLPTVRALVLAVALDRGGVAALARQGRVITDDRPWIEYAAPEPFKQVQRAGFNLNELESLALVAPLAAAPAAALAAWPALDEERRVVYTGMRARLDAAAGRPADALERFRTLAGELATPSAIAGAHLGAAELLLTLGRARAAERAVAEAAAANPDDPRLALARRRLAAAGVGSGG